MEREYGNDIDIDRQVRKPFGFKADRVHRSVLVDSSNAKPGGSLNIQLHKIKNEPIIPGSLHITFKAKIVSEKDKTATFVQNLGRALIVEKELTFNGKRATIINEFDQFKIYSDLWLSKGERKARILQGIQSENGLKYRIGSKTKNSSNQLVEVNVDDDEKALKVAYGSTFKIPLDDELFTEVAPFCPYFINDNVVIELKLAEAKNVILSSDGDATYQINDVHLEWDGILDIFLANELKMQYQSGLNVMYDRVQFLRKESHSKSSGLININIRESLRSLRGVMILFKDADHQKKYACKREVFYNPGIEKIEVSINGKSNQLYTNGLLPKDLWYEARKYFQGSTNMTQGDFYHDKFCVWLDTRSTTDNTVHGNGLRLDGSNSGMHIAINKATESGSFTMYIFLVIDAVIDFSDGSYKRICYALDSCPEGDGDM